MAMLETPSRLIRRLEAGEGLEMPSLPSLPAFDEDSEEETSSSSRIFSDDEPLQSTPAPSSAQNTARLASLQTSSTSSTARFAHSIASRASRTSTVNSLKRSTSHDLSFNDVSPIPSFPQSYAQSVSDMEFSEEQGQDNLSLSDALRDVGTSSSPEIPPQSFTPQSKKGDYSGLSLRSETKMSPLDKMRQLAYRRPLPQLRTPSLTHTPSPPSSSANSTPRSNLSASLPGNRSLSPLDAVSVPLPPSQNASPADHRGYPSSEPSESLPEQITVSESHASESAAMTQDDREPTFSSEEAATPRSGHSSRITLGGPSQASSSSSVLFTPTPAFAVRPRARFPATPRVAPEDDPTTSFTRRRSFLMDVINSTARPRFAQPTPYLRHATTAASALSPGPSEEPSTASNASRDEHASTSELGANSQLSDGPTLQPAQIQSVFAGVTPAARPRTRKAGRLSQPLARNWELETDLEDRDAGSEGFVERPSFASTVSSHDLAIHVRANASFDPAIGLGGGHGLGRFDATKLNSYLHGLNRRLQEESESLSGQVAVLKNETMELAEENAFLVAEVEELRRQTARGGRRSSGAGRRSSDVAPTLGDVAEDVGGEGWMEEKAAMEEDLDNQRAQNDRLTIELRETTQLLEDVQGERARIEERWQKRIQEIEKGVQAIIQDLEAKLERAQAQADTVPEKDKRVKELQRALREAEEERALADQRAEKAEQALAQGQDLGEELRETNDKLSHTLTELRTAHSQIDDLELELKQAEERFDQLAAHAQDERDTTRRLQQQLEVRESNLSSMEHHVTDRDEALQELERELAAARQYIVELETEGNAVVERFEALEEQLNLEQEQAAALVTSEAEARQDLARLEHESKRNAELAHQMEDALSAAEDKAVADEAMLSELRRKIANLERERSRDISRHADNLLDDSPEVAELEAELDDAYRKIGKLEGILAQSPARNALEKARETRLEMLEKEREELLERVKAYSHNTPSKLSNMSSISPMHRQVLNMTMRAPKTPGGPLAEMSWLHPSASEQSMSAYVAEIKRLQMQLDQANEDIDEKLDRLNNIGFDAVQLRQQLADERARTLALEDDVTRQARRDERRMRRLQKTRCTQCHAKMDLRSLDRAAVGDESSVEFSMLSQDLQSSLPPSKSSETLKTELRAVNKELTLMKKRWQEEKRQLLGDKAILQDATNRLNAQMREAERQAGEKERVNERELDEARRTIAELEEDLQDERKRLRSLTSDQGSAERERDAVLLKLKRAESDMEDVRHELDRLKVNKKQLESELRMNTMAEQKTHRLEAKVAEHLDTMEHLRHERSQLASEHKKLQQRFRETTDHLNKLREEHASSQASHDEKRHALDLRMLDIADLRKQLAEKTETLQALEARRTASEQQDRVVAGLESDLARLRRSAEVLGRDLRAERARRDEEDKRRKTESISVKRELEHAERAGKQAGAEARLLRQRIGSLEDEKKAWQGHKCTIGDSQVVALRTQHKLESKGLMLQIGYLKAKFKRENLLRTDLGYQKKYLLVLLARHERGEEKVLAAIARIGFPLPGPSPKEKRRTLKSIAQGIVFLSRARRASEAWKKECQDRPAIIAALDDVHRRRARGSQLRASGSSS